MASPPAWLTKLANEVADQMQAMDVLAPIGCHFYHNTTAEQWEVSLFAANTEVIGGKCDGKISPSCFGLELRGVVELFSKLDRFQWQTIPMGADDELGSHISLEGTIEDVSVWLRILACAPPRFEIGRYLMMDELRIEETW